MEIIEIKNLSKSITNAKRRLFKQIFILYFFVLLFSLLINKAIYFLIDNEKNMLKFHDVMLWIKDKWLFFESNGYCQYSV